MYDDPPIAKRAIKKSDDPREIVLNDASRRILEQFNYDSHFATLEDRCTMETRLFLARYDALMKYRPPP